MRGKEGGAFHGGGGVLIDAYFLALLVVGWVHCIYLAFSSSLGVDPSRKEM